MKKQLKLREPHLTLGFPGGASGKEPTCWCRRLKIGGFKYWVGKILWRREWKPTPVFLPGNPMDRGAWRATVRRVAQSWTQLKHACVEIRGVRMTGVLKTITLKAFGINGWMDGDAPDWRRKPWRKKPCIRDPQLDIPINTGKLLCLPSVYISQIIRWSIWEHKKSPS